MQERVQCHSIRSRLPDSVVFSDSSFLRLRGDISAAVEQRMAAPKNAEARVEGSGVAAPSHMLVVCARAERGERSARAQTFDAPPMELQRTTLRGAGPMAPLVPMFLAASREGFG